MRFAWMYLEPTEPSSKLADSISSSNLEEIKGIVLFQLLFDQAARLQC